MKHYLLVAIVLSLTVFAKSNTATAQPSTIENASVVDAVIAAFNNHDAESLADLHTETATIYRAVTNKTLKGRTEIAGWFSAIFTGWPDGQWTKKRSIEQGHLISLEFVFMGSHKDLPGKMVKSWDAVLLTIENGLISEGRFYYDVSAVVSQLEAHRQDQTKDHLMIIDEWFAALQDHDPARWVALHSESVVWTFPQSGGRLEGRAELRSAIEGFVAKYPDIRFEKLQVLSFGESVALEWREWGTDIAAGKPVEYYFSGFLTIKDGKVTQVQRYGGLRESK